MAFCILCKQQCAGKTIHLRTGSYVCASCISEKESKLQEIQSLIFKLRTIRAPTNVWDIIGAGIIVLTIASFLYLLFSQYFFLIFFWSLWLVVGLSIYSLTSKESKKEKEPFKNSIKEKIGQLSSVRSSIRKKLDSMYEQYWDAPSDWWSWRRAEVAKRDNGQCKNCGRRSSGSRVPFHVHHVIPKSKAEGNHTLENLVLLCEICHSKVDEPGHELVKAARKQRLKEEKNRRYRRRRW